MWISWGLIRTIGPILTSPSANDPVLHTHVQRTKLLMHRLDLERILPSPDRIVVKLVPECDGRKTAAGKFRERVEVEPVDYEGEGVDEEEDGEEDPEGWEEGDRVGEHCWFFFL